MEEKFKSEIESRFQAIGVRIAELANLSSKSDLATKMCEELNKELRDFKKCYEASSKFLCENREDQEKRNGYLQHQINQIFENSSSFYKEFEAHLAEFQELYKKHYALSGKHYEVGEKISNLFSLFGTTKDSVEDLKEDLSVWTENHLRVVEKSKEMDSRLFSIPESISSLKQQLNSLQDLINQTRSEFPFFQDKIDSMRFQLEDRIREKTMVMQNEYSKKFDAIKIPDVSPFIERKELDELRHLLNLALLDAKNALSRSNSNEMQQQILSKKVEGLHIQLNMPKLSS